MKHIQIKPSFKYPKITEKHYTFGSNKFIQPIVVSDGDWRPYLPIEEEQNRRGVESSACFIEAQQHAIATLEERLFGELNNNYSARFNALRANGTEEGGDPLEGAESIRKDGLINEDILPFNEDITSWNEYHSYKGQSEALCISKGQEYLSKKTLNYDIVFERHESIETKYRKLKEALKYSPIPLSVTAWYRNDNGEYFKPEGSYDNHFVLCVYLDENNCPYIWDTYSPFLKKLTPLYNSDFAMRVSISKKTGSSQYNIKSMCDFIKNIIDKIL